MGAQRGKPFFVFYYGFLFVVDWNRFASVPGVLHRMGQPTQLLTFSLSEVKGWVLSAANHFLFSTMVFSLL